MRRIDSKDNKEVKLVASLCDKKYRDRESLFFFEGAHLLEDYLSKGLTPRTVYFTQSAADKYGSLLIACADAATLVSDTAFEKMSTEKAPQGIITVSERLSNVTFGASDMSGGCLMLSSVRDAGNLGTILRTANALGIKSVICSADCADVYGSKTVRAGMGAIFRQNIIVADDFESEVAERVKRGIKVYAAALGRSAVTLCDGLLTQSDCIMIGNEGQGIAQEIMDICTSPLLIPMEQGCESLNAASAATVLMWEMRRSRHE